MIYDHPQALTADRARTKRGRLKLCVAFQGGSLFPSFSPTSNILQMPNALIVKDLRNTSPARHY
jgi:hypothetical protein